MSDEERVVEAYLNSIEEGLADCDCGDGNDGFCESWGCAQVGKLLAEVRRLKAAVVADRFIDDAKRKALNDFEFALYKISRLPLWTRWRAKAIAQQALGTGPFWDQDWATHPWYVRLWRWVKSVA